MASFVIKNIRKNLYGIIRFLPASTMDKFRAIYFRSMGLKIGNNGTIMTNPAYETLYIDRSNPQGLMVAQKRL